MSVQFPWTVRIATLFTLAAGFFVFIFRGAAEEIQYLNITLPGGMPGTPTMGLIQQVSNGVSVTWFGPAGYYRLFEKTNMNASWLAVGGLRLTNQAILSSNHANSFFSVAGPDARYAGSRACLECHSGHHASVLKTAHGSAFTNGLFAIQGGQTDPSCLACHTVGYGLPTGFAVTNRSGSLSYSTHLAGVQCENCHGPAARHASNPSDFTVRPRVEIAATMCGGCHTAQSVPSRAASSHRPYYGDWNTSRHRAVNDSLRTSFSGISSSNSIQNCGRCHSGTVRQALVKNVPLPGGHEAGAVGVACSTCHDPHDTHVHTNVLSGVQFFTNQLTGFSYIFTNNSLGARYTNQLRDPLNSLADYRAAGAFATNHNPRINGCAQCHNDGGASFEFTATAPHPSLQYNLLLGTVGEMTNGVAPNFPSAHSRIEKQCAACHMQTSTGDSGHKFRLTSYETCASCHGTASNAQGFASLLNFIITSLSGDVQNKLAEWGATRSPSPIRSYGALAWEYETAGALSSPSGTAHGPARDEQQYIPVNIRKARFNLYLVANDGSFGVHNGPMAISLLQVAQSWVTTELDQ